MYGGSITGNEGQAGGGVYLDGGTFNMHGGSISNNNVKDYEEDTMSQGGGVYIRSGTFNMRGGTISNNTAFYTTKPNHTGSTSTGRGGGIFIFRGSSCVFNFYDGTIANNTAESSGGGIYADDGSNVNIIGGTISGNISTYSGAGVSISNNATLTMSNGTISGNETPDYMGGGISVGSGGICIISGGTISNNIGYNGAGIEVGGKFEMTGGEIINNTNTSDHGGAGLHHYSSKDVILAGTVKISGNKTSVGDANVYIESGRTLTVSADFNTASPIGIASADVPTDCSTPVTIITGANTDTLSKFKSEYTDSTVFMKYSAEDGVIRVEKPHTYKTTYDKDSNNHWYECSVCQAKKNQAVHTWNNPTVTKAATCTAEGSQRKTCSKCSYTTTETIPATGHNLTRTARKEATCTADGNIEYWYCSVCKKYFKNSLGTSETTKTNTVITKKGHTEETIPAVAATCTATGLTAGKKCSVCGTVLTEQTMVDALGHD